MGKRGWIKSKKKEETHKESIRRKKVADLIETEYIAEEASYYSDFSSRGAEVNFMTYLWGEKERVIVSDVMEVSQPVQSMEVTKKIADCNPNDYAIVLTEANYVACRLREIPPMGSMGNVSLPRSPAAVRFMAGGHDESQNREGSAL